MVHRKTNKSQMWKHILCTSGAEGKTWKGEKNEGGYHDFMREDNTISMRRGPIDRRKGEGWECWISQITDLERWRNEHTDTKEDLGGVYTAFGSWRQNSESIHESWQRSFDPRNEVGGDSMVRETRKHTVDTKGLLHMWVLNQRELVCYESIKRELHIELM